MCMQCASAAMMTGAAATGLRAWLAAYRPSWLGPRRLKALTVATIGCALLGAGLIGAPV